MASERGPIYGVELIDSLPLDGGKMRQALPSRGDLDRVREISGRTVAGYEVLCEHYQRCQAALAYIALGCPRDRSAEECALNALDYPATSELWEMVLRRSGGQEETDASQD